MVGLVVWGLTCSGVDATPHAHWLSPQERDVLEARLEHFYRDPSDPRPMFEAVRKYSPIRKRFVEPNSFLRLNRAPRTPLERTGQLKATPAFRRARCETFFQGRHPGVDCSTSHTWAAPYDEGTVERLAQSWLAPSQISRDPSHIPIAGEARHELWTGYYWPYRFGAAAHRYYRPRTATTFAEAFAEFRQPAEYRGLLGSLSLSQLADRVAKWSPTEKYDLTVGDEGFGLSTSQWHHGASLAGSDGDMLNWYGLCQGWAAASLMWPRPDWVAAVKGARGVTVTYLPADIKALSSLLWAKGQFESNSVGGRCISAKVFPNGRLASETCFDVSPSVLHLALGNMMGRFGLTFIMDKSYDYTVWNYPIKSYRMFYFDPLDITQRSNDWRRVAVDYDERFRSKDRFQDPLTRGKRMRRGYDDSEIEKVVGVVMTIEYVSTEPPKHSRSPIEREVLRETFTYDLEIAIRDGSYVVAGGEWHENAHPDFLWVPRQGEVPRAPGVEAVAYQGEQGPSRALTRAARRAGDSEIPMCSVLKELYRLGGERIKCAP